MVTCNNSYMLQYSCHVTCIRVMSHVFMSCYMYSCHVMHLSCILSAAGTESSISVGIIDLTLSIIPQPDVLPPEVLEEQSKLEKNHQAERDRLFLVYTKQWWREYLQIRPSHSTRSVQLYAQVCSSNRGRTMFLFPPLLPRPQCVVG